MKRVIDDGSKPLGLVWINCTYSVIVTGLTEILQGEAQVHVGTEPPKKREDPLCVVLCADETGDLWESVQRIRSAYPSAVVVVFCPRPDLRLAWVAFRAGARGYVHARMQPEQMLRALRVALRGEIAAPRNLLEYVILEDTPTANFDALSARQREILGFVDKGLTNAHIAERLFLSESTVKQHLRAAYKVLGVSNRTEAASRFRGVKAQKL